MENFKLSNDVDKSDMFSNTKIKEIKMNDPDTKTFLEIEKYSDPKVQLCEQGDVKPCKKCSGDICDQCNDGYYKTEYDTTTCEQCFDKCETCEKEKTNCFTCIPGYFIEDNFCYKINETDTTDPTYNPSDDLGGISSDIYN